MRYLDFFSENLIQILQILFSKLCLPLLLLFLFLSSGYSQKALDFDTFSTQDGFSGNKVNAFLQDSRGFLWVGTWNGLTRFDGYESIVYKPDLTNPMNSLSNREVTALLEDRSGNLWIGTSSGLNCLDPMNDEFLQFPFDSRIASLYEDSDGKIWIGTWNDGLYCLDIETGEIEQFYSGLMVVDILESKNGDFWIATYNGLVYLNRSTKSFVRYLQNEENLNKSVNSQSITSLVEMPNGDIWVGSWGGGLSQLHTHSDLDSITFTHYTVENTNESLSTDNIYKLCYDSDNNLWIATWDKGIAKLDSAEQYKNPESAHFQKYVHNPLDIYSISDNNVTAIYADKSGNLWVGSSKINRAYVSQTGMSRYALFYNDIDMSSQNTIRAISGDGEDNLWIGTTKDLIHYEKQKGVYQIKNVIPHQSYYYRGNFFTSNSVLSLEYFYDGLLVGTDDAGLLFYKNTKDGIEKSYKFYNSITENSIPGDKVTSLKWSEYYPNTLWIGTMLSGFSKATYNQGSFTFENYNIYNSNLLDDNVRSIVEDNDGYIWIATQKGLNRLDSKNNKIESFSHSPSDKYTLNDNIINVLKKDLEGNIWVGTNAGLNKIVKKDNGEHYFKRFLSAPMISNEAVINIMISKDDNEIVLGFYENIVKFNIQNEEVVEILNQREYQRIETEINSSFVDNSNTMFIGGHNGFISFNKSDLKVANISSNINLTDVLIENVSLRNLYNEDNSTTIPYREKFEFTHKDKIITFVFSSMNFDNPRNNNYSYFLEGFDNEWSNVGGRNYVTYTNLPAGKYILKLKEESSGNAISSFNVIILPAWWETITAYIFYFIIILGLLYFFQHYSFIRQKEKEKLVFHQVLHEKEQELYNLKTDFFINITHELRTSLSLIIGPAEEVLNMKSLPEGAGRYLSLIKRNSERLMRLINQLMEFKRIEEGKDELFLEKVNIIVLLEELKQLFEPIANTKNIAFELEYFQNEIPAWIDVEKLEKVIYNMLSNAFKYVDNGGRVFVKTFLKKDDESKNTWFIIEVSDDGIGIDEENLKFIFERFYQVNEKNTQSIGGLGLYLCKSIVEQHKGYINVDSTHGQGTQFTVEIPINLNEIISHTTQRNTKNLAFNLTSSNSFASDKEELSSGEDNDLPKVLIVEDDSDLLEFLKNGLESLFSIFVATNGEEGYNLAVEISPDIIVSDVIMPKMDGFQMGQKLRENLDTSHIPIFYLTAKSIKEAEIKGLELGAIDYIYKPFNMEVLRLKLQNVLDAKSAVHESFKTESILQPQQIKLSSLDEEFLTKAVKVVDDNIDDPKLDVEKFSDLMSMSSNQAYRKIKALTGYTAKEFIRIQRLKVAASLIEQKKRNISEIIYMVGFSSPSYFSRCFKEQYGCTPTEYADENNLEI